MIEIACRAFVVWNEKVLLCKQGVPKRDYWTLPGGSLQEGETLTECTARELFEETSVNVTIDGLKYIRELITVERHRIEFYFRAHLSDGEVNLIKPNNEIEEICFFSLDEIVDICKKPDCLFDLCNEIIYDNIHYPVYLGNVK